MYSAPRCSIAYLWKIFALLASLVIPLLVCFVTQGLWKKTNTYLEQPRIEFTHKSFFLIADSSNATTYCFWSSYQQLNDADSDHLVMPIIESQEIDRDNDGKADKILISATLHTQSLTFPVNTVFFHLLFNVQLEYRSLFKLELPIMGYIEHLASAPEVAIYGDLRVKLTEPLPSYDTFDISKHIPEPGKGMNLFGNATDNIEVNTSLIQLFPLELLHENLNRNISLELDRLFTYWGPTQQQKVEKFTFNFFFKSQIQEFCYRTSAVELLKWFWLQYFSIFVFSKLILCGLSSFLYENQIFPTLVYYKEKKKIE